MINRYSIVVIFLLAAATLVIMQNTPPSITGYAIKNEVNVSVGLFDDGRIGYFDYPAEITQYSRMNITLEFINTGSTLYTKKTMMYIGIYDSNYTSVANRTGATLSLNSGQRSIEKLRYTPLSEGLFWIHIIVSYADKTAEAWGSFYVKPYYNIVQWPAEPTLPSSGGGGGGGSGGGGGQGEGGSGSTPVRVIKESDTGIIGISLSYPDKIRITPGETSVIYVIANNTGTMTLRELVLLPSIIGSFSIDAQPMLVQTLRKNQSAIFMITIDTPLDAQEGIYPMEFTLSSDKVKRNGHIDLFVVNATIDESLDNAIRNYQYILSKLEDETDTLGLEGKNTTNITKYLGLAKDTLNLAKASYRARDYGSTRDNLRKTHGHLTNAIIELALARSERVLVVLSPSIWLFILLIAMVIISAATVYIHKRNAQKERQKKAEEEAFE